MSLFDVQTPFFRPLWRRVAVTVVCLAWAAMEVSTGAVFWAILFGAAGLYLAWQFFVVFDPAPDGDEDGTGKG
ncbi:MAG: hypothetical protein OXC01_12075 [Immundisolibacterales bacterium]|nr:hypothetical protein [Immundisolibacterales bacterium]